MSNVVLNNWQQYSSDLWPLSLKAKRNCIICWQIAQIIKNAVRLILDNFGIVGFLFFGLYQWIRLTSLVILIIFWAQKPQNILVWTF
jgi:hypothetical protein